MEAIDNVLPNRPVKCAKMQFHIALALSEPRRMPAILVMVFVAIVIDALVSCIMY